MARRSIDPLGLGDREREALLKEDESFYGVGGEIGDFGDSSDNDSDVAPAEKLLCLDSDEDEDFSSDVESQWENQATASAAYIAAAIRDYKSIGCECQDNHWLQLDDEKLEQLMVDLRELPKRDLKIFVMGQLTASGHPSTKLTPESRRKWTFKYHVLGMEVCRQVFLEVHGISRHSLRPLQDAVSLHQVAPPEHGSRGRIAHNAVSSTDRHLTIAFLKGYASTHGIPQPAAERGRAKLPPIYLPASCLKTAVFKLFQETEGAPRMSYRTFRSVWKVHCSDIIVQKPRSDVCAKCEKLRERVRKSKTEEDTEAATTQLQEHLKQAVAERSYYNELISDAKSALADSEDGELPPYTHLTFDFAQQLELPQHTRQVGPLYFKSRFRVQLFGVCDEAKGQQTNYVFHEGETIGEDGQQAHGPNAVISMLHNHLSIRTKERTVHMHCDNCVGQNKNRFVIGYLCWRLICGESDGLQLSFMRVGHTRCSVDGYFGLLKMKYRSTEVDSMADVDNVINTSCSANSAVRHSWPWCDWKTFIGNLFKPVKGIAGFQHFRFDPDKLGTVVLQTSCSSETTELELLRPGITIDNVRAAGLPAILSASGLSVKRLAYLEKNVEPFLGEGATPPWSGSAVVQADEQNEESE